jgi:hypothetical protein
MPPKKSKKRDYKSSESFEDSTPSKGGKMKKENTIESEKAIHK